MQKIRRGFFWCKDLLFPVFCVGCDKEESWICTDCLPKNIVPQQIVFTADSDIASLDGLTALSSYDTSVISELVRMLKYRFVTDALSDLQTIISKVNFTADWHDFVIVPVPLHARRERERGFNQAELIANLFAQRFGLVVNKKLRRAVYTRQQAALSGEERRKNLTDAFMFEIIDGVVPANVLLVDDVFTTGSTLKECAKALKAAGVQTVWGLVLAKG